MTLRFAARLWAPTLVQLVMVGLMGAIAALVPRATPVRAIASAVASVVPVVSADDRASF